MAERLCDKPLTIEAEHNGEKLSFIFHPPNNHSSQQEIIDELVWNCLNAKSPLKETFIRIFIMYHISLRFKYKPISGRKFSLNFLEEPWQLEQMSSLKKDHIYASTFKSMIENAKKKRNVEFKDNVDKLIWLAEYSYSKEIKDSEIGLIENLFRIKTGLDIGNSKVYFNDKGYIEFREELIKKIEILFKEHELTKTDFQKWFDSELKDTNPCYKKLLELEAESYYQGILDIQHHRAYRKMRKTLTKEEKRGFILMTFMTYTVLGKPSPKLPFGKRIPTHSSELLYFFLGMDEFTKWLILRVLIYKDKTFLAELTKRWKSYVRVYPFWLAIIRWDESEGKALERSNVKTTSFQACNKKYEDGNEASLEETIGEKDAYILQKLTCEDIYAQLTGNEKKVAILFGEGYSVSEIAHELKVSQPYISKIRKQIKEKVKKII